VRKGSAIAATRTGGRHAVGVLLSVSGIRAPAVCGPTLAIVVRTCGQDRGPDAILTARIRRPEWWSSGRCIDRGGVGGVCQARAMPCDTGDARDLAGQLDGTSMVELQHYTKLEVESRTFGYIWEPTVTVGLRQTIAEQLALVGERPEVFEVQFTAYGYGWVVVHLEGVERDELAELVFEAWRLTAPAELVEARGEKLPV
jgi:hypothetical protein